MQESNPQAMKMGMLRYGGVKAFIDGSIGSHSAAFFEDYSDQPNYKGDFVHSKEHLKEMIMEADSAGH
jgi:predicted amidohydrolase YtcJ